MPVLIRRVILGIMVRALIYAEIPYFLEEYFTFEGLIQLGYLNPNEPKARLLVHIQ